MANADRMRAPPETPANLVGLVTGDIQKLQHEANAKCETFYKEIELLDLEYSFQITSFIFQKTAKKLQNNHIVLRFED